MDSIQEAASQLLTDVTGYLRETLPEVAAEAGEFINGPVRETVTGVATSVSEHAQRISASFVTESVPPARNYTPLVMMGCGALAGGLYLHWRYFWGQQGEYVGRRLEGE